MVDDTYAGLCESEHEAWWAIFLGVKGVWLLFGAVLSVLTRDVAKEYNESSSIAYAVSLLSLSLSFSFFSPFFSVDFLVLFHSSFLYFLFFRFSASFVSFVVYTLPLLSLLQRKRFERKQTYNNLVLGIIGIPLALVLRKIPGGVEIIMVSVTCIAFTFTICILFFDIWYRIPFNERK